MITTRNLTIQDLEDIIEYYKIVESNKHSVLGVLTKIGDSESIVFEKSIDRILNFMENERKYNK